MIELTLTVPIPDGVDISELGDMVMEALIRVEHSLPGQPYDLSPAVAISQGVLEITLSMEGHHNIAVLTAAVNAAGAVFTTEREDH